MTGQHIRNKRFPRVFFWLTVLVFTGFVPAAHSFELQSPAFEPGEMIPSVHTCQGKNVSPPLAWEQAPEGTRSFALICEDPDAPGMTWVHWVYFNIPDSVTSLPEGIAEKPAQGGMHGKNSFGDSGYGGPCPPSGTHRYFFRLYAVDRMLDLAPGAEKQAVLEAMEGHVLGRAVLMGTYRKQ